MHNFLILLLALAILNSSPAFSRDSEHTGIYAGGMLQYAFGTTKLEGQRTQPTAQIADLPDISPKGIGGGLLTGIGFLIGNKWYFGPEVYLSISGADGKKTFNVAPFNGSVETSLENTFGVSLRAGMVTGVLLTYGKVGLATSQWKVESKELSTGTPNIVSGKKRATGIEIGAGVASPAGIISDNFIIGTEYSYTKFQGKKLNIRHPGLAYTKIKPEVHTISIKLTLKLTGDLWPTSNSRGKESL